MNNKNRAFWGVNGSNYSSLAGTGRQADSAGKGKRKAGAGFIPLQNYQPFFTKLPFLFARKVKSPSKNSVNFVTGFTLIELLVVIGIIATLASVVLTSLKNARVKSRDIKRISDIKQLQLALELYFHDNGNSYPGNLSDLDGSNACGDSYCIRAVPQDPVLQTDYPYTQCGTAYHLGAGLEEKKNIVLKSDRDAKDNDVCPGDVIDGTLEDNNSSASCDSGSGRSCYDITGG